jgi:uncharacterized protein (DUF305 family)
MLKSIVIYISLYALFIGGIGLYLYNQKIQPSTAYYSNVNSTANISHNHSTWTEPTFIEHMIPHHEEAIRQSKTMLTKTQNTKYQAILNNIIEVQTREVAEMKQWYQEWNNKPYEDKGVYEPMMSEIYSYTGKKLEREWLQSMVYHHQAAIYMSQSGLKNHPQRRATRAYGKYQSFSR